MSAQSQGFIGGGLAGAGTGAMIGSAFAGPTLGLSIAAGAAIGFVVGGISGAMMADAQQDAADEEAQRLEQARVDSVMREFGVMQQKQNMATAGSRRNDSGRTSSKNLNATQTLSEAGFIGQNMINSGGSTPSSSGTF
jgi:hypothetical protein